MEHRKADVRTVAACGMSGDDDTARFLHELRQLRNGAGLGHAQLAARAHYPYDSIKAAEVGPSLPDLPVLSAFVRGCGGPTQEWEERWRSLSSSPSLPVSATRQTGRSDAATAGARISSAAPEGDGPDPSVILAALNRVAEEMADPGDDAILAPPVAQPAPALPSSSFSSAFASSEPAAGSLFASSEPAAGSLFASSEPAGRFAERRGPGPEVSRRGGIRSACRRPGRPSSTRRRWLSQPATPASLVAPGLPVTGTRRGGRPRHGVRPQRKHRQPPAQTPVTQPSPVPGRRASGPLAQARPALAARGGCRGPRSRRSCWPPSSCSALLSRCWWPCPSQRCRSATQAAC